MRIDPLILRRGFRLHYTPLFLFAAAAIVAYLIIVTTIDCSPNWLAGDGCSVHKPGELESSQPAQPFGELRARILWGISALVAVMGILVAMLGALSVVATTTPRAALPWVAGGLVALFPLFIVIRYVVAFEFNEEYLGAVYRISSAKSFVSVIEAAAYATLVALAVSVSMILRRIGELSAHALRAESDGSIKELSDLHGLLRMLLFLGAIALVAGTLQTAALYHWSSFFLITTPYFGSSTDLSASMALLNGMYYSALLATIFVPALILTSYYFGRVARLSAGDSESTSSWLAQHRLEESLANKLWSAVAVLAPVLIGAPLSQALQALTS